MNIVAITSCLEQIAPLSLQEEYDNSGLLIGEGTAICTGVLCVLDVTDKVLEEAVSKGCNLIVTHHPLIFRGLKKLNGDSMVERLVMKAIRYQIAIYAIHTNLDNVFSGVNGKLAQKLGIQPLQVLAPMKKVCKKLVTFIPKPHLDAVRNALFLAGAGNIGAYSECGFHSEGWGSFRSGPGTKQFSGIPGVRSEEKELRLEMLYPAALEKQVVTALKLVHPYEEVAYNLSQLDNPDPLIGAGLIGQLPEPMEPQNFLHHLKSSLGLKLLRHTNFPNKLISKVALCGGAGSFLISNALAKGVDAFVTSDLKYHEFFEPDGKLLLADIGHFESERFTIELLADILQEKFPTFAVLKSGSDTNPVNYYF
jgi:dinuclear metal center YbgI/SA1388 family protein